MRFNNFDDDEKEDFFEEVPPEKPKPPKPPVIPPDDPRYWDREESEWEHLRIPISSRNKLIIRAALALLLLIILWILFKWIFGTSTEQSVAFGYVDDIEYRGKVVKTYEGVLIPYKEIHDTTRIYKEDFRFSTSSKQAAALKAYQGSGRPVKITYRTYNSTMPWRGETRRYVERVDTVSPDSILPPEFNLRPKH